MTLDATTSEAAVADAPIPQQPDMRVVPLDLIVESRTNQRTVFNEEKLAELAASIKASGVHQPILIRPLPGDRVQETSGGLPKHAPRPTFEVIAGARRLRASRIAGMADIPALVRQLTDSQALRVQIIENLQREDITELEEASGFDALMKSDGLQLEDIAAEIGKSVSHVRARVKLLALCPEAREALATGKMDASKALLIARIPDPQQQIKATNEICRDDYYGERMSYRRAQEHVQGNYMLRLDGARFKITDATLLPEAGSCRTCEKRTGANRDLFADVKSADVCTDPPCYRKKEDAHQAALLRTAHERGQTVIEGKEAKALMPNAWGGVAGYLRLDDARDSPTDKPLRKLLGKDIPAPTIINNPYEPGELIEVLPADKVNDLLKARGHEEAADLVAKEAKEDERAKAAKEKRDLEFKFEEGWRKELFARTWARIAAADEFGASENLLRYMALRIARGFNQDRCKQLCKLLDLGKVAPFDTFIGWIEETAAPGGALLLVLMVEDVEHRHWLPAPTADSNALLLVASEYDMDVDAIKAEVKASMRAEASEKKKVAAKADSGPAQATSDGEKGSKNRTEPPAAAPAKGRRAKTTAQEAQQGIAAAMQQEEEASAHVGADAGPPKIQPGYRVKVRAGIRGPGAKFVGETGTVLQMVGTTWSVEFARVGKGTPIRYCSFMSDELEIVLTPQSAWPFPKPEAAAATETEPPAVYQVGDIVRFKEGLRGTDRHLRKVCGREGPVVEVLPDGDYTVQFGAKRINAARGRFDELVFVSRPTGSSA